KIGAEFSTTRRIGGLGAVLTAVPRFKVGGVGFTEAVSTVNHGRSVAIPIRTESGMFVLIAASVAAGEIRIGRGGCAALKGNFLPSLRPHKIYPHKLRWAGSWHCRSLRHRWHYKR